MKTIQLVSDLAILGAPPLFDEPLHVGRPNIGDREVLMRRIGEILDRRWLSNNGPMVQEFERRVADYVGVRHCVAMCNGTIALEIAIRALGLQGEVIVPSFTFIATAHALHWQGITPVFADIDPATHNLDPASVERAITPRTTGIIGVHVWGRPAPVEALDDIARRHRLQVLYDASHALGCAHGGRMIGGFGRCEVFSFHATKFVNSFEGGAVVTDDDELAQKMRLMKNFGFVDYDKAIHLGTNGKMTEVCAAMGLTGLDSLEAIVALNRNHHANYSNLLSAMPGLSVIRHAENDRSNYQYVVAEVGPKVGLSRDHLICVLHAEKILARKYFWPGCHRMMPYRLLYPDAEQVLPHTTEVAGRVLVLPTGTGVTADDINGIAAVLRVATRCASAVLERIEETGTPRVGKGI